ncbi:MAG: hypothetical protein LUC86_05485 [Prevotellaceae bacterium]|nr:hypothetical protein [Prevotellaceae bacterium]MCD8304261.1 hypothetical protein [Prevotellaceae bacterium]
MDKYTKPSLEVLRTETQQMLALSTASDTASPTLPSLDKGDKGWADGAAVWGD